MDPKWEQNRGIEERYAAYLEIAAGKRTIVEARRFDSVRGCARGRRGVGGSRPR